MPTPCEPVLPTEGRHVIHLFLSIDHGQWDLMDDRTKIQAKTSLSALVQEIRAEPDTQLVTLSMVTPKADLGFMLVTPDLQVADSMTKKLILSLGAEVLAPEFSYLSMTERSEYTTSEEDYAVSLTRDEGLKEGTPEFAEKIEAFRIRMQKYGRDRLEPNLPDWPVFCFYPMSKRRAEGQNWYALDFDTRKQLMAGHARVGRTFAGRVRQLITGSTGLDDMEWGVTLFAQSTTDIKEIVYEMRFDEVSAKYADFGAFFIGLQMPLDSLFSRAKL